MNLWQRVLAFKKEHDLYFHPLQEPKKKVEHIEEMGCCICDPGRQCPCEESLEELADPEKMRCKCLLFVTEGYMRKWGYEEYILKDVKQ